MRDDKENLRPALLHLVEFLEMKFEMGELLKFVSEKSYALP